MNFKVYWKKMLQYLEDENWPLYDVDNDEGTAVSFVKGDNLALRMFVWLDEDSHTLNVSWHYPNSVPINKYHLIHELMNRLNYRALVGKFVMEPNDGDLAYRISIPVKGLAFSKDHLDNLLGRGIYLADEQYPKFMSLIYGSWTVDEVLEGKGQPELHVVGSSEEMEDLETSDVREETDAP